MAGKKLVGRAALAVTVVAALGSAFAFGQNKAKPAPTPHPPQDKFVDFVMAKAPAVPSLSKGGFATKPSFEDNFDPTWAKTQKVWEVATWKQNKTLMSPDRCKTNADGHLVQTVLAGAPGRGGSMQSAGEFGYGRWVARLRPSSVPGVLNTMFTKDWDDKTTSGDANDGTKDEVDIELLSYTYGPGTGKVHLAMHLPGMKSWAADVPLDFNPSDDFHEWGFDILPDRVVWHVDGKHIFTWKYSKEHFVHTGYEMFFNSWTWEKWIQGPPKAQADYHIDWVRFYPLTKTETAKKD